LVNLPQLQNPPAYADRCAGSGGVAYWLVGLMALNAFTINLVGQWRFAEIALLGLPVLNFSQAQRHVGRLEKRFLLLFALTAFAQVFADIYNDVLTLETAKRAGTFMVMNAIIIATQWLSCNDPKRIALLISGFCLSYVLLLFVGSGLNEAYAFVPWRLGLGGAVTLFLLVMIAVSPFLHRFAGFALMGLAGVHVSMDSRTMAGMTAMTGILVLISAVQNKLYPPKFRIDFVALIVVLAIIGGTVGIYGLKQAVENKLFHEGLQEKMERQMSHPYGLLAAGRPETAAAIYAVSKRPLLGWGSTAQDTDVEGFYAEMVGLKYQGMDNFDAMLERLYNLDKEIPGLPSHSHIFGAWVDAGLLGAVSWMAFLGLAVYVLTRAMFWRHPWAPLFVYVALGAIWTMLFSPGPIRVKVALDFMIFAFAIHQFKSFDQMRQYFDQMRP